MAEYQVPYTGQFAVIDTTIKSTDSYLFDGLNGRQGDDGRRVHIQFRDSNLPHDLTGETVELQGKDAKGMTKTTQSMERVYSAAAGTCSFLIPGAFYQAVGPYQSAYFVIKKTDTDQVVSTIPVSFSVMESAVFMTAGESVPYLANVDGKIEVVSKRVDSIASSYNTMLDAIDTGVNSVGKQLAEYMNQLKNNKIATLDGSNSFTGSNHFSNLIADSLSGAGVDSIKGYVDERVKSEIGNINLPQGVTVSPSSRDLTIYNGASASSASDSLYVWKETYPGAAKIYGVGKVHINHVSVGENFHIKLPYRIYEGDFITCESFTNYQTKAEILNNEVQVFLYGDVSNQDVWIDFEIAGLR